METQDELFTRWLNHAKFRRLSDKTIENVEKTLAKLDRYCKYIGMEGYHEALQLWNTSDWMNWFTARSEAKGEPLAASTITTDWNTLRMFCKYNHFELPIMDLPNPIDEPKRKVTMDEAKAITRAVSHYSPDVCSVIYLAMFCGLRASEIAAIRVDDFYRDEDDLLWLKVVGKGRRIRKVPVAKLVKDKVNEMHIEGGGHLYIKRRGRNLGMPLDGDGISARVSRLIKKHAQGMTLHDLRHFYGTQVYQRCKDPFLMAVLLGHAVPTFKMTAHYAEPDISQAHVLMNELVNTVLEGHSEVVNDLSHLLVE